MNYLIPKELSDRVLMIGVYWKNHAPGGVSSVVNTYAENFETFNYTVTAAILDENKIKKLWVAIAGLLEFTWKILTDKRVKIIHVQGSHGASYDRKRIFVKLAKMFGKKIVWHMHASSFVPFYEGRQDKEDIVKTLNLSDVMIVLSKSYYDFYKNIGVDENKLLILNNIVPKPVITNAPAISDKRMHYLFLGEISQRKGVFDIMEALKQYPELRDKVYIRIGGNGESDRLRKIIKEACLEECVNFEGWVGPEKKTELLNWADVYILPSFNEGLPISILEALSYNCPIISTHVGGIPDVVKPNENGIIVKPGDIKQIADAIAYYVKHPMDVERHGAKSAEIIKDYYPENVFATLSKIYGQLLKC